MLSKSLIQFSANEWVYVPSLQFDLGRNYDWDNGNLLQEDLCQHAAPPRAAAVSGPNPTAGHY